MSNTKCVFLITFIQKHRGSCRQLGTWSARHWQLGTPGKGLACGRPILPDLAYMVTVDFHAARKTGPESGSE